MNIQSLKAVGRIKMEVRRYFLLFELWGIGILVFIISGCGGDESTSSSPCFNLNIQTIGWGTVSLSPDSNCYHEGTQVELTATADQGWVLQGWSGDASGDANSVTVTIGQSDLTVNAQFALEEFEITISIVPQDGGYVAITPDDDTYHLYDVVTLTAVPYDGYFFDRWTGDTASTVSPIEIAIAGDLAVDANFYGSGPDSATLNGTISWPGHLLSYPILVLFDADWNIQAAWYVDGGVASAPFSVKFSIDDVPESYIHAVDNLDNDLIIFETGEPWNCYDGDGDYYCDYIEYTSGEVIDDIDIILYSGGLEKRTECQPPGPITIDRDKVKRLSK